jgi:glycosyltransferase involved in cell wall biosynthesis
VLMSVVTPALNGMKWLSECIDSTLRQASPNVEVEHIVVDGGSTDGTPEYAASRGCTVLTREEPSIAFAINKGVSNARGELIGFLGCDDVLLPGALDAVARRYQRGRGRWFVGGVRWLDERGVSRGDFRAPPSWLTAPALASLGWNCIPPMSTYLNRDLLEETEGFLTSYSHADDYEFFVRLLSREKFERIGRTLAGARRHSNAMSMDRNAVHLAELETIAAQSAPPSASARRLSRYGLKLWLNATNPRWSALKRVDAFRARHRTGATSA